MNPIEDRLRAAFSAQAEQLTEGKLDRLAADRQTANRSEDDLERGEPTVTLPRIEHHDELAARRSRTHRWVGPSIAAAAVVALAAGVIGLAASRHGTDQASPAGPSSNHTAPTHKPSVTPSNTPTSPSSTDSTQSSGHTETGYLGTGQTGQRSDVPWSQVGLGWRLIQPADQKVLYLYDPADGRYLITDALPYPSNVVGWSPDGTHAMLTTQDQQSLNEIDLRTGVVRTIVSAHASFYSYTRPKGLAVVVRVFADGKQSVERVGLDGTVQQTYDQNINGVGAFEGPLLYTPDGSMFVVGTTTGAALISNSGDPLRTYAPPSPGMQCAPDRLWDDTSFVETCVVDPSGGSSRSAIYVQPIDGSTPHAVYDNTQGGTSTTLAWPLSNGDVLLQGPVYDCASFDYTILHPDGTVVALRLPTGVSSPVAIVNMSGDLATFQTSSSCTDVGTSPPFALVDYDMVTGETTNLLHTAATLINYPSK